jgi:hypothetical protein
MKGLAITVLFLILYVINCFYFKYKKHKSSYNQVYVYMSRDEIIENLIGIVLTSNALTWILANIQY